MTNLEAADLLDNLIGMVSDNHDSDYDEALSKGRDILKSEPCDDCISRQAAIDAVKKNTFRLTFAEEQGCEGHVLWSAKAVPSDAIEGALLELPSVTPQPKTGHWNSWFTEIKGNNTFNCMECGSTFIVEQGAHNMNYCPNCGCRMVEPQESEG